MDLMDRYVYDVGRRIPTKQRDDIEKELKSLLMDALDARTGGKAPLDEDVASVIKEFGQPADVAARYTGEKYLIGPRLYPTYRLVVLIVLAAMTLGLFLSIFVGYFFQPMTGPDLASRLLQFLGSLVSSIWASIGVVTVVFWGIERGMERRGGMGQAIKDAWDPKSLPPVPKHKDAWKPSDSIVAIVFIIIALVLFNVFPDLVSVYGKDAGGQWQRFPIISPDALAAYLPFWNIGWALSLAFHAMMLVQRRWRTGTNLAHIALQLYGIAVVAVMMAGPALLNASTEMPGYAEITKSFNIAMPMLNMQFRWVFLIIIAVCLIDIGKSIYRMVRDK